MAVSVRKVEKVFHETGVGQSDRVEVHYELGDEINGTWVPFSSVSELRVEEYAVRAEREAERLGAQKPAGKSGSGR